MESDKQLLNELVGRKIVVKTHGGTGTKEDMLIGDYKCILLEYDDKFIKVEYELRKFIDGKGVIDKLILFINISHIITIEDYQEKE
jgi:hypothetical protein